MKKFTRNLIIFLMLFSGVSCQKIKNSVNVLKWQNAEFSFPENINDYSLPNKNFFKDQNYTILTFIDGSCSQCIRELIEWTKLSEELQKKSTLIIVVYSQNGYLPEEKIREYDLNIYFDHENILISHNNIPENKLFHTFLIDRNAKVKLIGNPLFSEKLKRLYIQMINN